MRRRAKSVKQYVVQDKRYGKSVSSFGFFKEPERDRALLCPYGKLSSAFLSGLLCMRKTGQRIAIAGKVDLKWKRSKKRRSWS